MSLRPDDSCIHKLLEITCDIFSSFDCNPTLEIRDVFLDMTNAFDMVWHYGLLFRLKLKFISINCKLFKW